MEYLDKDFIQALTECRNCIDLARGHNDCVEVNRETVSPELIKLSKSIEAELQLLRIKIDGFIIKNN